VRSADQELRSGHRAVTLWLDTREDVAFELERLLFDSDCRVHATPASASIAEVCAALNAAGVIALVYGGNDPEMLDRVRGQLGADNLVHIENHETADSIHRLLKEREIV
jgi:hypothetical protein